MEFLKSILANREAVTADTVVTYDLPVNPLSAINIDVELKLSTAFTAATKANIAAIFDKAEVIFKGTSIVSLNGADLLAYNAMITGRDFPILNRDLATASEQVARFRIPFGRYPFSQVECFPAVRRGELQLKLDYASSFTAIESLDLTITTIELMGASPKQFLKATTLSKTPVVGDNDVDLPMGNKLLSLLLFGTTVPLTTAKTSTIDLVKLLVDNVETYLHQIRWPELNFAVYEVLGMNDTLFDHTHRENTATAYTQNATTAGKNLADQFFHQYGLIDFDPLRNDAYLFDTAGKGRIWVRVTAGDTGALRIIPVEIIELGAA